MNKVYVVHQTVHEGDDRSEWYSSNVLGVYISYEKAEEAAKLANDHRLKPENRFHGLGSASITGVVITD